MRVTKIVFPQKCVDGIEKEGSLLKAGTTTDRIITGNADNKFINICVENTATSGDNRGMYLRHYTSGTGGGGDAARIFHTVNNVTAGTCHGAHVSLNFGTSGKVTGLGVAGRNTLHVPNVAAWSPGTIAAVQAEIYSDGSDSDTGAATEVSYIRVVNDGNASGIADVDDDAYLLSIQGGTIAAGNLVNTQTSAAVSHTIRCKVGTTVMYLMASTNQ